MSWVTVAQVIEALGPSTQEDDFLLACTDAANAWAFRRRKQAGYVDDSTTSPGPDASLGVITYAVALYRERGSVDSYASFEEFSVGALPPSNFGQVLRLLGVPRPQIDRLDTDLAARYRGMPYRGFR